jgi:hypothetical protein
MANNTTFTQGIKNPWQRISILFALAVISALSSVVTVVYYQKNSDNKSALDREIKRADNAERNLQDCYIESIKNAVIVNQGKDKRLSIQDTTKQLLNIK